MSLEINKKGLSGNAIRVIENARIDADLNKDGKISGEEEISIFNKHIENSPALTRSERRQILGEKKVKEDSDAKKARKENKADKKEQKDHKKTFDSALESFVDKGTERKDIINELEYEFIKKYDYDIIKYQEVINNEKATEEEKAEAQRNLDSLKSIQEHNKVAYEPLITKVKEVLNLVKVTDINAISMHQIDDFINKLVQNAKDQTERKILRQVGEMIKNEKINAAQDDVANRYAAKVKDAEDKGKTVTDEEIMDEILKELKNEGKYVIDNNYGERDQNEYVTAYKNFNNGEIAKQARILLANVINGKTDPEEVEGRKIHKEAKEWLKDNGLWDKNVRKANNKHRFGRKVSNAEGLERNVALNTVKSQDELLKAFGKNGRAKIEALMNTQVTLTDEYGQNIVDKDGKPVKFNLIEQREDGYYDLTNLSKFIRQQVGADNTYNKHKHKANSEHYYLESGLNGSLEGTSLDLSDKEIVNLVELCGYDKEGKAYSVLKGLFGAAAGALSHGLAAGAATITNQYQGYIDAPPEFDDINLSFDLETLLKDKAHQEYIRDNYKVLIDTTGNIKISIKDLMANEETFLILMPKLVAQNAVKSAAIGAIIGLLAGFQESEEIPAIPTKVEQDTIKDYNDALKASPATAKYASLLVSLAMVNGFVDEDGNLDNEGFQIYLQRFFAGNDILNKDEFFALQKTYLEGQEHRLVKDKPVKETEETESTQEEQEEQEKPKDVALVEKQNEQIENRTYEDEYVTYNVEYGDSWAKIIEEFYPDLLKKYNGKMYDTWKNGKRNKGAIGALKEALAAGDKELLKQLREQGDIPKTLNLPKIIEDTAINPNADKVEKVTIATGGSTTLKEVGKKTQKMTITYSPGLDLYIAYDEAAPGQKYTGSSEEEAIAELEKHSKKDFEEIKRTNY